MLLFCIIPLLWGFNNIINEGLNLPNLVPRFLQKYNQKKKKIPLSHHQKAFFSKLDLRTVKEERPWSHLNRGHAIIKNRVGTWSALIAVVKRKWHHLHTRITWSNGSWEVRKITSCFSGRIYKHSKDLRKVVFLARTRVPQQHEHSQILKEFQKNNNLKQ